MSAKSTSIKKIPIPFAKKTVKDDVTRKVSSVLDVAGVRIDGDQPWDIQVKDKRFFARVLANGALGLGESYMDGWWECRSLDQLIFRLVQAELNKTMKVWRDWLYVLKAMVINHQTRSSAYKVGEHHYDIGIDLYRLMLDRRMIYSCGYWKQAENLDQAQEAKLDLVAQKLGLEPGMRVLDIGCGWGGSAKYLAEKYQVDVVGITISKEQAKIARDVCRALPVDIHLMDYRKLTGKFDRAFSVGMFEHVGRKNYRTYMNIVADCLDNEGLFLLHTIGANLSHTQNNLWVERYIFPNSKRPSMAEIAKSVEQIFYIEDVQNFGPDYDKTLMAWNRNFNENWRSLENQYDERFYRMWNYYLLSFAGAFRGRVNQVWQVVLSKKGQLSRFDAPR